MYPYGLQVGITLQAVALPDVRAGGPEHLYGLLVGVALQTVPVYLHNLIVHLNQTRPEQR